MISIDVSHSPGCSTEGSAVADAAAISFVLPPLFAASFDRSHAARTKSAFAAIMGDFPAIILNSLQSAAP